MAGDPVTMSIGMGAIQGIAGGSSASRQAMIRGMQANSQFNDSVVRGQLQTDLANLQKAEQRRVAGEQQRAQFTAAYKNAVLNNSMANEVEQRQRRDASRAHRASNAQMKMRMQSGGSREAFQRATHQAALETSRDLFMREYATEKNQASALEATLSQRVPVIMDDTFIPGSKPIIDDPRAAGQNAFLSGAISGAMQGYSMGSQIYRNNLQIPE